MRIGIDARWIIKEASGIGQYTINLIRHLSSQDQDNQYFLFFFDKALYERYKAELNLPNAWTFVLLPYSVFSLKNQLFLHFKLKELKVDVFHSTNFMIPLYSKGTKIVITIHDLIPFLFPQFAPKSKKSRFHIIYKLLMNMIIRRADHIFVDSEHSYKDMSENFKGADKKMSVLTFGVDPSFFRAINTDICHRLGIKDSMILYVGRQDPYKNITGLIETFHKVVNQFPDVTLIIAGPEDERYPEIKKMILELALEEKVRMTGYLSQADLVSLYRQAKILVMPSFYEGFGLPILEAFSSGVPVIASKIASIPEIVGDAGILLNPENIELWVDAILKLLNDEAIRKDLIGKGFERLKNFSWDKAAYKALLKYGDLV